MNSYQGPSHITPEKFENAAFRKRSSNRRNLETQASDETFQKDCD